MWLCIEMITEDQHDLVCGVSTSRWLQPTYSYSYSRVMSMKLSLMLEGCLLSSYSSLLTDGYWLLK